MNEVSTPAFDLPDYQRRPIRFLRRVEHGAWRIKLYGISACTAHPPAELVEAAVAVVRRTLPDDAFEGGRYGVAFAIVHEGRDGSFVLVDWWVAGNMLQHRVFAAPPERPLDLDDWSASGIAACIWELPVLAFERDAWVRHVLGRPRAPDFDAYLGSTLDVDL